MEEKIKNISLFEKEEYLVMACSGACDLGNISDIVARKLKKNKICSMSCLTIVGAGITSSIEFFKAHKILMLDGCSVDCGKKILGNSGITNFKHIRISDLGYEKGKTPVTEEIIKQIYEKIKAVN